MASSSFLYSAASVLISSVIAASGTGVACTHSAAPGGRAGPDLGPALAAHHRGGAAPAMRPTCTILAITP